MRHPPIRPRAVQQLSTKLWALPLLLVAISLVTPAVRAQDFILGKKPSGDKNAGKVTWTLKAEPQSVAPGDEVTVTATYDIEEPWYIYSPDHDPKEGPGLPTKLLVEPPALEAVDAPTFPKPTIKKDQLLGTFRTLKGKGAIARRFRVPTSVAAGTLRLSVKLNYQRCDPLVCIQEDFSDNVTLTVTASTSTPKDAPKEAAKSTAPFGILGGTSSADKKPSILSKPGFSLGNSTTGVEAEVTWDVATASTEADRGGKVEVIVRYRVKKGWHIYAPSHSTSSRTTITVDGEPPILKPYGKPKFPEPKVGRIAGIPEEQIWLDGDGEIRQPFALSRNVQPGSFKFTVNVRHQVCDDKSCLVPADHKAEITLHVSTNDPVTLPPLTGEAKDAVVATGDVELVDQPIWLFILLMIGGGLFALAMPCTYPMIPITISVFTKQAEARSGSVLPLALAYGAGIVVIFNLIGWLFAGTIGPFAARPSVNFVFGLAFVVFAFSLFGYYEIRLPSFMNQLVGQASNATGYIGVFLLGTLLVVSSFTCTAPVMGPLLTTAVQGGEGVFARVTLGMTVFGLTVATPFVFLSLFPARVRSMPRAGEWMHVLKVTLGFVELAAALKFFSNVDVAVQSKVLPRELFLLIWAVLAIIVGLYLFNVICLKDDAGRGIGPTRLLTGSAAIVAGFYFLWGAFGYKLDWITSALAPPYHAQMAKTERAVIVDDLDGGLAAARTEGKPVLINFTGHT